MKSPLPRMTSSGVTKGAPLTLGKKGRTERRERRERKGGGGREWKEGRKEKREGGLE